VNVGNFSWLLIVPILAVLVIVHEFGHYLAARYFGVKVEEFGVGLPPRIIGREWKGTLWSLNWIPLGGFARMKDENSGGENAPDSFQVKPAYARAIILLGGVVFNLVFAALLYGFMQATYGVRTGEQVFVGGVQANSPAARAGWQTGDQITSVDGASVNSVADFNAAVRGANGRAVTTEVLRGGQTVRTMLTPPTGDRVSVTTVVSGSPAETAGWRAGDQILRIGGQPIAVRSELTRAVDAADGQPLAVELLRDGQPLMTTVTPRRNPPQGQGKLGITLVEGAGVATGIQIRAEEVFRRLPLWEAIPGGFVQLVTSTGGFLQGLGQLFTNQLPGGIAGNVQGPIGIAQTIGEVVQTSPIPVWLTIANITAIISINLAIFNLLPIPALDGGRLVFVVIEMLRRGKRVPAEREGLVHLIGMAVLLSLFVLVASQDILRIFEGRSILPR